MAACYRGLNCRAAQFAANAKYTDRILARKFSRARSASDAWGNNANYSVAPACIMSDFINYRSTRRLLGERAAEIRDGKDDDDDDDGRSL